MEKKKAQTPKKKSSSLDRVLSQVDRLDEVSLSNLVKRLARERKQFEGIFNTLQEGILVIDLDGRIDYANQAAHRLIGMPNEDLDGSVLWRLVPGLRTSLEAAMSVNGENRPVVTREIELSYPEARTVRLYLVPFELEGAANEPRYAVIMSDITRDKISTEERIESERTSSILLLAAGVAHELGNPLNSLTIHLQLMERRLKKMKAASAKEAADFAESIRICSEEVSRLDGIITHFLEAIRPTPPDLSEQDLAEVLSEVLRFQQNELADRRVQVEAEVPGKLPLVMADANQVKQVFFNVIKNAMEAMQPGGALKIKARVDDDHVFLMFGDNGSGIRQEDLVKLFQPYHTTKVGGSGLGLMIVQRIMRGHGGQIGIESKEGLGTVVTLQFPRKDRRIRMLR